LPRFFARMSSLAHIGDGFRGAPPR
jgi:hypothetical protein